MGDAFLDAMLADPAADGPRLVWADWLDGSDAPADRARARLVRVQLALARLPAHDPRRLGLLVEQADLLHQYGEAWAGPLDGLAAGTEFRRGLIEGATVPAAAFLKSADALFAAAPLRRIRLTHLDGHLDELAASPDLGRLRELDFCDGDLGPGGVRRLLASRHLTRLRGLNLTANRLDDDAAALLAGCHNLPGLRALGLSDNPRLTAVGAAALAASGPLAELRKLDLSHCGVTDAGVRALAAPGALPRLEVLGLAGNPIGDGGVAALAASALLPRLMKRSPLLDLARCAVGPRGAAALADCAALDAVAELDLAGNLLGDLGVMRLAESDRLGNLRRLTLSGNSVTDAGGVLLARSPLLQQLRRLDVSGNHLGPRGKGELAARRPYTLALTDE
jgi:uncharacterized protein (TIGR02996 family)